MLESCRKEYQNGELGGCLLRMYDRVRRLADEILFEETSANLDRLSAIVGNWKPEQNLRVRPPEAVSWNRLVTELLIFC